MIVIRSFHRRRFAWVMVNVVLPFWMTRIEIEVVWKCRFWTNLKTVKNWHFYTTPHFWYFGTRVSRYAWQSNLRAAEPGVRAAEPYIRTVKPVKGRRDRRGWCQGWSLTIITAELLLRGQFRKRGAIAGRRGVTYQCFSFNGAGVPDTVESLSLFITTATYNVIRLLLGGNALPRLTLAGIVCNIFNCNSVNS